MTELPDEGDAPVIRDKRRIDPTTGEVRAGVATSAPPAGPAESPLTPDSATLEASVELAERTADLQRLQAEYANYRRRVDRDRQAVAEQALAGVLGGLLPVLAIDRARAHGESGQAFTLIADGLDATLTKLGLARFGEPGEPFDPTVHEALTHGYSAEVTEPVSAEVFQPGYRVGERVLRPARVAVLEPEHIPATAPEPGEPDEGDTTQQ